MKAILDLNGFTKLLEVDEAHLFINHTLDFDGQTLQLPFVKIETREVDGEEIVFYKMFEPKKDMGLKQ